MTEPDKVLICSPVGPEYPAHFADDLFGVCTMCGRTVRYRPSAPKNVVRICFHCMPAHAAKHRGGKITLEVTKDAEEELKLFYSKPLGAKQ